MAGRIIGLIPRSFVIVLIENHVFYDEGGHNKDRVSNFYRTAVTRQESVASLSEAGDRSPSKHPSIREGSIDSDDEPVFGDEKPSKMREIDESI